MDTSKARRELDWAPTWSSADSARELIDGSADGVVGPSPALGPQTEDVVDRRGLLKWVHDITLCLWGLLSLGNNAA